MKKIKQIFKDWDVSDWFNFALLMLFGAFCIGSFVYFTVVDRLRDSLNSLAYILIIPCYYILIKIMHIKIPVLYAVVFVAFVAFSLIGAGYNLYTIILSLDNILHALWGIIFFVLGFTMMKSFFGEPDTMKAFALYSVMAVSFSALTAIVWEMAEFTVDSLFLNLDMQEDTLINSFHSFLLNPVYDHYHTQVIEGIAYTVLYDAQGNVIYTIEGGYIDVGLRDTMWDIIWCTVGSVAATAVLIIDWRWGKKIIYRLLVPKLIKKDGNIELQIT